MKRVLAEDGYAIDVSHTGEEARILAFVNDYDGIILDLDLGEQAAAEKLMAAIEMAMADPALHTPDLGGTATTAKVTAAVCGMLQG